MTREAQRWINQVCIACCTVQVGSTLYVLRTVSWDVMHYSLLDGYQYCRGSCCLHLQGIWNGIKFWVIAAIFMVTRIVSPISFSTELPARAILISAARWDEDDNCNNLHITVSSAITQELQSCETSCYRT